MGRRKATNENHRNINHLKISDREHGAAELNFGCVRPTGGSTWVAANMNWNPINSDFETDCPPLR